MQEDNVFSHHQNMFSKTLLSHRADGRLFHTVDTQNAKARTAKDIFQHLQCMQSFCIISRSNSMDTFPHNNCSLENPPPQCHTAIYIALGMPGSVT